ncbi:MAG: hypothetical protein HN802_03060 [Candidatus Jacksonbacteria bacterium]|nr:hypothetical protein [Candidatus Jacksonbacteria bacterium]
MAQEQVGNALEGAPESDYQALDDIESGDFFESLDTSVNSGIIDSEYSQSTSQDLGDNTPASPSGVQEQGEDALQKRYSDSSREAKRLNGKLNELEPYMPILDAMREDPNLITHVRNYFEGGGQAPESMAQNMELPEDFSFDPDDAFTDPKSDSAKVFGATVDGIVQRRLNNELGKQKTENQRLARETAFRQKSDMTEDEWSTFVNFAKNKSLELDDIYYLMKRKERESNIADNARQQVATQMKKVQEQPRSLATAGSVEVETSQDDQVFDALLGIDQKLDNAFG